MRAGFTAVLALICCTLAAACRREPQMLRLAAGTTIDNSGLLDVLLPKFHEETGVDVQSLAVGTGKALQLLRHGDADLAFTHDPELEATFLKTVRTRLYSRIMFNEFLIVGPADDPAAIRTATGAVDAMRRIARAGIAFASRGDSSGTHLREQWLWTQAGTRPPLDRLLETGQGMAATLRVASERGTYCLSDPATFAQLSPVLRLAPLFQGAPELLNAYAVTIVPNSNAAREQAALRLADWLATGRGRGLIADFAIRGVHYFTPWPLDRPRDRPDALPK